MADHGFTQRRERTAIPLITHYGNQNIATMIVETPFDGFRTHPEDKPGCQSSLIGYMLKPIAAFIETKVIVRFLEKRLGVQKFMKIGISFGGIVALANSFYSPRKGVGYLSYMGIDAADINTTRGFMRLNSDWQSMNLQLKTQPEFVDVYERVKKLRLFDNPEDLNQIEADYMNIEKGHAGIMVAVLLELLTRFKYQRTENNLSPHLTKVIVMEDDGMVPIVDRGYSKNERDIWSLEEVWPEAEFVTVPGKGHCQGLACQRQLFVPAVAGLAGKIPEPKDSEAAYLYS